MVKRVNTVESDILIIGSGAAGATLAKDLSGSGKKIVLIEKGRNPRPLGRLSTTMRVFDGHGMEFKNRTIEGDLFYRAICLGGTTVLNLGNAVRVFGKEFKEMGIDLDLEFQEAEEEMSVSPAKKSIIGKASQKIADAAEKLGYKMQPMPKCLKQEKCRSCGSCVMGCIYGAKWSSLDFLQLATKNGVDVYTGFDVKKIIIKDNLAKGVEAKVGLLGKVYFYAHTIIIAAGALSTPVILLNSNITKNVGHGLFFDFFPAVYGIHKEFGMARETPMTLYSDYFYKTEGLLLSTYIDAPIQLILNGPKKTDSLKSSRMMGVLVKTKDEPIGIVYKNGGISKPITEADRKKIKKAIEIAKELLLKAGVKPNTLKIMPIKGAHPGGTAAIGKVINNNLETEIKNLFVCDASIFPNSLGAPPILTIVAMAKKLAKYLKGK